MLIPFNVVREAKGVRSDSLQTLSLSDCLNVLHLSLLTPDSVRLC